MISSIQLLILILFLVILLTSSSTVTALVFNSTGRLFPVTFMIDNQLIEKVKQYRYLGVMFDASGSFSDAKEELYKRGLKALFKMYKCFEEN